METILRKCASCGAEFHPNYDRRRTCSTVCSKRYSNSTRPRPYDKNEYARARMKRLKGHPKARNCAGCGVHFTPLERSMKYCTAACRGSRGADNNRFMAKFGIALADYEAMSERQGHVCAMCKRPEIGRKLAIDHCHRSGRVRALLCFRCNTVLGRVEEDDELLRSALEYLELHRVS